MLRASGCGLSPFQISNSSIIPPPTMNRILATLVNLAVGLGAFAQVGNVNLNNNFTPPGANTKAYILGLDRQPMAKALGAVEVLDSTGALIKSGGLGADGLFFLGVTAIPFTTPGGAGTIIIRAWDVSTGSTYATATFKGQAIVTLTGLGGGAIPPPGLGTAGNFTGLPIFIPEPSSVILAALGAVGLFMAGRRHR
ncbi:MAG: PEP-CTERM sorting domain-containing protein [Verrucomicrobiales bacterium]|nr:PEP-CTERM sorting domain-containing protein [Verrucomicrobiales bacterium]